MEENDEQTLNEKELAKERFGGKHWWFLLPLCGEFVTTDTGDAAGGITT